MLKIVEWRDDNDDDDDYEAATQARKQPVNSWNE